MAPNKSNPYNYKCSPGGADVLREVGAQVQQGAGRQAAGGQGAEGQGAGGQGAGGQGASGQGAMEQPSRSTQMPRAQGGQRIWGQ